MPYMLLPREHVALAGQQMERGNLQVIGRGDLPTCEGSKTIDQVSVSDIYAVHNH